MGEFPKQKFDPSFALIQNKRLFRYFWMLNQAAVKTPRNIQLIAELLINVGIEMHDDHQELTNFLQHGRHKYKYEHWMGGISPRTVHHYKYQTWTFRQSPMEIEPVFSNIELMLVSISGFMYKIDKKKKCEDCEDEEECMKHLILCMNIQIETLVVLLENIGDFLDVVSRKVHEH